MSPGSRSPEQGSGPVETASPLSVPAHPPFDRPNLRLAFKPKERSRPVENKWIGQQINQPDIDLAMMARAQGAEGIGPITRTEDLAGAVKQGLSYVQAGKICVIDVRVLPGYDTNMSGSQASQKR